MTIEHEHRPPKPSGLMAAATQGSCAPLMGRPPQTTRGLLVPDPDLPHLSLSGSLWATVAVLAPCLFVVAAVMDGG